MRSLPLLSILVCSALPGALGGCAASERYAAAPAEYSMAGGAPGGSGASVVELASTATAARARLLVRDVDLTYEVPSDDAEQGLRARLRDAARGLGGYVTSEYGRSMVIRLPASRVDEALAGLEALGTITERSVHVQEVTAQYTDLAIRIENARRLRARLQALLAEAKDVKEMLEVERELARVTLELEQHEGSLRILRDRIALSTLTIRFEDEVQPGPIGWVFYGLYHGVKWLFVWD
ncbi:DUF4349 domain-containing protein [Myxococcota bacterium]|nr:DUF4349 domain-containing protein [Myxococcota bacterium]